MPSFWQETALFGNTLEAWGIAIGITIATYFALLFARKIAEKRVHNELVTILLARTRGFFIFSAAILAGLHFLPAPLVTERLLTFFFTVLLAAQFGIWGETVISFSLTRSSRNHDPAHATTMVAVSFVAKIALWGLLLLLVLDNLGVNVTALLAGLGVGGVAVALAVQNILGDLFASLSIVLDKPFVIGDVIQVGGDLGTVERIGLKTTRLKSLSGEQLIYSNSDLLKSHIRNYRRMNERRIQFVFNLAYDTSPEKMRDATNIIQRTIEAERDARFERCNFIKIGTTSLDVETVFHVRSADYNAYCILQEKINLAVMEEFRRAGIDFAFPTHVQVVAPRKS